MTLRNPYGLHARPAARFVMTASQFDSDITVRCGAASANGKSIMGLLSLCARSGDELEISAVGDDALRAAEAIKDVERLLNEAE
jgi:phosphotransferase system HPr (HPr) family protein